MSGWLSKGPSALRGELISGEHGKIDDGQLAVSVDHDGTPGKPFDQPGQGEVPDRIPVVSTGLHDEDEETTFEVGEEDIFEHLHGGVHAVHHLESAQDATNDQATHCYHFWTIWRRTWTARLLQ